MKKIIPHASIILLIAGSLSSQTAAAFGNEALAGGLHRETLKASSGALKRGLRQNNNTLSHMNKSMPPAELAAIQTRPNFNSVQRNNVNVNKAVYANNTTFANQGHTVQTQTTFIQPTPSFTHTSIQHNNTAIVRTNQHIIVKEPGPVINPNHHVTVVANHNPPVIINKNTSVNINNNRPYGYSSAYYGPHYVGGYHPVFVPVYHPYYYNNGYYNNNVNDFLAVALTLSLMGNVAQYAAHNSQTTNTVVYQPYPVYPPYSTSYTASTMSVNQTIPYAPQPATVTKPATVTPTATVSTSSAPINITVNTTVDTTPAKTTMTTSSATQPAPDNTQTSSNEATAAPVTADAIQDHGIAAATDDTQTTAAPSNQSGTTDTIPTAEETTPVIFDPTVNAVNT